MSGRLKADELRAAGDPASLPFRSTAELASLDGVIGQERAGARRRRGGRPHPLGLVQ